MLAPLRSFVRALLGWRRLEREMAEEWRFHVEARTDDLVAAGASRADAERRARREFGDRGRWREDVREIRGLRFIDECRRDAEYGFRQMRRAPAFTATVIATLALGIGATTAIFTVVNAVLLRPLPYRAPGELVMVWSNNTREAQPHYPMSPGNYIGYRDAAHAVSRVEALYSFLNSSTWQTESGAERVTSSSVTRGMFELLGRGAMIGRTPVAGERDAVVLSEGFWTRRYGRDAGVLGRRIVIDNVPGTIVGVMPADFVFPFKGMLGPSGFVTSNDADVWLTINEDRPESRFVDAQGRVTRSQHFVSVVARLAPGRSLSDARQEADRIAMELARAFPNENRGLGATVEPVHDQSVGAVRAPLLLLLSGVVVVLLIACVNVGSLMFARAVARHKEIAVRGALGARRGRLLRQLLIESLLFALLGGALGVALALVGVHGLVALAPPDLPRLTQITPDARVLMFAAMVSIAAGLVVGIAPAFSIASADAQAALKESARGTSAGPARLRLRAALVSIEIALAVVLTLGASLLVRSFVAVMQVDPGFRPDRLLTLQLTLPARIATADARLAFYREMFARLEAVPGVTRVGGTTRLPLGSSNVTTRLAIEGRSTAPADLVEVEFRRALHDYFPAMGIPIVRGRAFTPDDGLAGAAPVVVVNEAMARKYWPGGDPLGQRIRMSPDPAAPWSRIVGVVGSVRHAALDADPAPEIYISYLQNPPVAPYLAIRTAADPVAVAASVRAALRSLDAGLSVYDMRTMTDIRSASMAGRRFVVLLGVLFGVVALLLAAVGVYGVMALAVEERTQEVGIRVALGARRGQVIGLVLQGAGRVALTGLVGGLIAFAILSPALRGQLYGTGTLDPATMTIVPAVLLAVALAATIVPALRAVHVDPVNALRHD